MFQECGDVVPILKELIEHHSRCMYPILEEKGYTPFTLSIECFTPEVLNNWLLWLRDNRNLKPASCNGRMGAMKCMLKYIGGRDVAFAGLYLNAKEHVKKMREEKVHIMGMTRNAVKALFAAPIQQQNLGSGISSLC